MKRITAAIAIVVASMGGLAVAGTLGPADDDLAVVKKAVVKKAVARPAAKAASASPAAPVVQAQAAVPTPTPSAAPRPLAARSGREPQWFKVRVVDKASGRKKVTVNLPLSLVRALGDEPIDWGCRHWEERERCHTIKISDVLRSLEAGQELVEIEDEEATVRVWVE
jgi:hypothetical protein